MPGDKVLIAVPLEVAEAALINETGDAQGAEGREMLLDAVHAALDRDQLEERIAKALWEYKEAHIAPTWNPGWDGIDEATQRGSREQARAVLAALTEQEADRG